MLCDNTITLTEFRHPLVTSQFAKAEISLIYTVGCATFESGAGNKNLAYKDTLSPFCFLFINFWLLLFILVGNFSVFKFVEHFVC